MANKRTYVIYDERAINCDTDNATVLCCADSLAEAKRDVKEFAYGGVVYSYREIEKNGEMFLEDGRYEWSGGQSK